MECDQQTFLICSWLNLIITESKYTGVYNYLVMSKHVDKNTILLSVQ